MINADDELIKEMTETLVKKINPKQVYLFGSRASGGARPDSDVDLLVVVDQVFGPAFSRRAEVARIRKFLSEYKVPKDILVYGSDEIARWRDSRNHVVSHCLREGRLLYERS
jgi:predicted nucleotidyltransferase